MWGDGEECKACFSKVKRSFKFFFQLSIVRRTKKPGSARWLASYLTKSACIAITQALFTEMLAMTEDRGSAGGKARAEALSKTARVEIARRGGQARWESEIGQVTHEGVLQIAGNQIPCYVTEAGVRLISGRQMQEALRLVDEAPRSGQKPGSRMGRLLNKKTLKPLFLEKIGVDHMRPIKTTTKDSGAVISGFRAEILADICDVMLDAKSRGLLSTSRDIVIADQCVILIRSFAKVGLAALVDEATGYQAVRPKDALQQYLDMVLRSELAAWSKRFPDEFYENIYKLNNWPWPGMKKNRFSVVAHWTNDLVYERIGHGVLAELQARSPKDANGNRSNKLHQWLSDEIGHPLLAQHLHSLLMFQRLAISSGYGWRRFVKMVDQVLPKKGATLELALTDTTE